jgi:hypothetical protein
VLRRKFITMIAYIKSAERSQIKDLVTAPLLLENKK